MSGEMKRPKYDASKLPEAVRARAEERAAALWCYVTPDGRDFYVEEAQAKAMQVRGGGTIFPPEPKP